MQAFHSWNTITAELCSLHLQGDWKRWADFFIDDLPSRELVRISDQISCTLDSDDIHTFLFGLWLNGKNFISDYLASQLLFSRINSQDLSSIFFLLIFYELRFVSLWIDFGFIMDFEDDLIVFWLIGEVRLAGNVAKLFLSWCFLVEYNFP